MDGTSILTVRRDLSHSPSIRPSINGPIRIQRTMKRPLRTRTRTRTPQIPQIALQAIPMFRYILKSFSQIVLPQAEKFAIQQVSASEAVGTGVSYLSAEPCPVKAWVGTKPHSNAPLSSGVAGSGGPSIIQRDLIPKQYEILPSPCNPKFQGIDATDLQGYVVLPMYLPNAAAIAGDASEARVLCLSVEFQVVEQVTAGFLTGRDALKAYKANIDEELGQIVFPTYSPPFYVPITETPREEAKEMDERNLRS
jgi:hypothetical protein